MAEQFLVLMADLDANAQALMSGWYEKVKAAGFTGKQTPGLPFHISMATFPLQHESEAIEITKRAAAAFAPITVHMSHIGLFQGGKVLYAAPDMNPPALMALREAVKPNTPDEHPWTPHCTLLLDEWDTVYKALPIAMDCFRAFVCNVTRLHLCAFWPTREILRLDLTGSGTDMMIKSCD